MTNINAFYPQRLKGWALGLNAGGGNLGVAVVQLVGLLVLATAGAGHPRLMVAIYIPLIVLVALGSSLYMDNLAVASNAKGAMRRGLPRSQHLDHRPALHRYLRLVHRLRFAFGQVLQVQFKGTFSTPGQGRLPDLPRPAARLAGPARTAASWPTGSAVRW